MKPLFSLLLLLLSFSVSAQQQKSINNTYTQTEVDLKLQLQQKEVECLQKDFEAQQQVIFQQKEQIKESIARQEQYIQSIDKRIDSTLVFIGILVTLIGLVFGYWVIQKTKESEKEVKAELEKIKTLKREIETQKNTVEKIKRQAEACLAKIEENTVKSDELINTLKSKQPSELTIAEKLEVEKEVKKTNETKTETEYTFDDWFWKAYAAQAKNEHEEACLYYKKAIELKSNDVDAYNNWGNALCNLGRIKEDEDFFYQGFEKYKKAIELNPNYAIAYYNWGCVLSDLGKIKRDEELFNQSIEKYKIAVELKTNYADAYYNWGYTLIELGKLKEDIALYKEEIESLLQKAEDIKEGAGSYNLACLYSLLDDKNKALKWLEKDLQNNKTTKEEIEKDNDFVNIKDTPEFKTLLDKYFPSGK